MNQRRRFTPEFKAQVVLEMLAGAKSTAQVCREYSLKDSLLARWKQQFLARAPRVFDQGAHDPCQVRIAELERLLGRLTMELEIAKKASLLWSCRRHGDGS